MLIAVNMVLRVTEDCITLFKIRKNGQMMLNIILVMIVAFVLAFFPPVVLCIYGANSITAEIFFRTWAWHWLCICCFGIIVMTFVTVLGPGLGMALHTLFLFLNVMASPAFTPWELMYDPLRFGIALPFQNGVEGVRFALFGSYSSVLPRCLGVNFGWIGLCFILMLWNATRESAGKKTNGRTEQSQIQKELS